MGKVFRAPAPTVSVIVTLGKTHFTLAYWWWSEGPVVSVSGSLASVSAPRGSYGYNTPLENLENGLSTVFSVHALLWTLPQNLSAMAYDRYIAICYPLQYSTVMTNAHIMRIITIVWMSCLVLIAVLFFLLLRLPRCRSEMTHVYCDNPSLLTLVCADTTINNIYGLLISAVAQLVANGIVFYTYLRILITCFRCKRSDTKAKALQTCATHLIVFLLLECLGLFTIISYRLNNVSPHFRRFMGLSTLIFPPTLNPIIYGLKTKDIREKVLNFLKNRIFSS
ncbi:olfactory receptor 52D1-like [Neolamprologus brichardi]|uniref:olfactory receptor 52D1-like n=1 Tax=Neolamprologus brichardi TaxID=32507 RepID=UPI001643F767|nr:olfactory receptor 52D1-like [Neolamprologus brichardi]